MKKMLTHNNWLSSNIDDVSKKDFKFQIKFKPYEFKPSSYEEACDEAARLIQSIGKPIFVGLSGGADSEHICRVLARNNIKFTPIIIQHGGSEKEMPYALSLCEELSLNPVMLDLDEKEHLKLFVSLLLEKLNSLAIMCVMRYVAAKYAMERNGVLITGIDLTHVYDVSEVENVEKGKTIYGMTISDWTPAALLEKDVEIPFYCYTPKMIYETLLVDDGAKYYATVKGELYGFYRPKIYPTFSEKFNKVIDHYKKTKRNPKLDYIVFENIQTIIDALLKFEYETVFSQ